MENTEGMAHKEEKNESNETEPKWIQITDNGQSYHISYYIAVLMFKKLGEICMC